MTTGVQPRIAMLSAHSCPVGEVGAKDTGGMSIYIRELARGLGKLGMPVDVYTRIHDPRDRQIIELGENARLIHIRAGSDEKIHKLAVYPHLPDFACNLERFRKDDGARYDLVFSHYWLSGWVGEYLQLWWDVPHVMTFHTLGAIKNATAIGEVEPELRLKAEIELARNCRHIIATTEKEKRALVMRYGTPAQRISVIPCGVNMELFQPVDRRMARQQLGLGSEKVILFVGRLEPLKGVDRLMKAITCLQNGQKPRLMIIGGDGRSQREIEKLRKLAITLRIEDSVTFTGTVKHEELPHFYSAADVCVISSYYESFGMVALESIACGTPVVATNVGGLKDIICEGETGYIVNDNTPRQLADKIALLLAKPGPDAVPEVSLRETVSEFAWPNIARQVKETFKEVLAARFASVL